MAERIRELKAKIPNIEISKAFLHLSLQIISEFGLEFKKAEECCLRARLLHVGEAWAFQIICNIIRGPGSFKPFV